MIKSILNNDKKLFTLIYLLLTALGVFQILSISSMNLFFTIIIIFIFFFVKIEQEFVLIFTLLPFFNFFTLKIGSTSLFYLFVIIFLFKYIVYKKDQINKIKLLILLLVLIDRLFSHDVVLLFKWFILFSFLVISYNEDFSNKNIRAVVNNLTYSFILASVFGYYMNVNGLSIYTKSFIYSKDLGKTIRFSGILGDSVFYAQFATILISANLVLAFYENNTVQIIKKYCIVMLLVLFTLLTYSKTGLLMSLICIVGYAICLIVKYAKTTKTSKKSIYIILVLILSFILLTMFIIKNSDLAIIRYYIIRFNRSDLFTGRKEIANHYISLIQSDYKHIFVAMTQSKYSSPFSYKGTKFINFSHNIYLETICCFGIIPSILIFLWLFNKIFLTFKTKRDLITLMPLMVLVITGFVLHGHFERHYYFLVSLALLFLTSDNISENEKVVSL